MKTRSGRALTRRGILQSAGALTLVPGAVAQAQAQAPKKGGTMVMIVQPEPTTLASYMSVAANVGPIATQIYEGLVSYDWDLKPVPKLASSWEIAPDGLSITFRLRDGVSFHNGEK